MGVRTTAYQTIQTTNTAQPVFGTWVTAAIAAGNRVSIPVNDSSFWEVGDYVLLMEPDGTKAERCSVVAVADGTHITADVVRNSHAGGVFGTGAFAILGANCNSVYIQTKDGNTQSVFLGNSFASKTDGTKCVAQLVKVAAAVQPTEYASTRSGAWNPDNTSEVWIVGTNPDKYLASFSKV